MPFFVFSLSAKSDALETAREVASYYKDQNTPLELQLDFIIINGAGIIANYKYPELTRATDKTTGVFFESWGKSTIAAFLFHLCNVYYATPSITDPILRRYLRSIQPARFERVEP